MPSGKKRTHKDFITEFNKNNPHHDSIEIIGEYEKNIDPILCKCRICGYEWSPTPKTLISGHGCPKCNNNLKLTNEEFIKKLKDCNPNYNNFELLEKYNGMSKKIKCRCKVCNTIWYPKANDLIRAKSGCPSCSGKIQYTHQRFVSEIKKKNINYEQIELLGEYKGSLERIKCRCKICGCIWEPIASSLIQGTGCPKCAEKRVAEKGKDILRKLPKSTPISHGDFLRRFAEKNPYSDIIVFRSKYKGANKPILCQCKKCGKNWQVISSSLLNGSGCPNCSHSSTSFMEQFLLRSLMCALESEEEVKHRDKKAIGKEIDIYLPNYRFGIEIGSWKWHKNCLEKDIEKLQISNSNNINLIVVYDSCDEELDLGEGFYTYPFDLSSERDYISLKAIVSIVLKKIGKEHIFSQDEWDQIEKEAYLHSMRITHDEFLKKLQEQNPHFSEIEILNTYTKARNKIKCKCKKCGRKWETAASELLKGTGCPSCQIKAVGERKSKKAVVQEWRLNNPNGNKLQCEKQTGISRMTVYKWWDS